MAKTDSSKKVMRIALLGGDTLLGSELLDVLKNRIPDAVVTTYSSNGEGNFSEQDGEAVFIEPLTPASVASGEILVFAGSEEGADKAYKFAKANTPPNRIIDLTGYLENQPEARIVSPLLLEAALDRDWLLVVAHPAAAAIAHLISRLSEYSGVTRVVTEVFEPASERGKKGASELHQQTTSLLAFKSLDKDVFDTQATFNLLSRYGAEAKTKLLTIEQRIERQLATLLGDALQPNVLPLPSVRLIHAPVFHGYSISIWVEFLSHVTVTEAAHALASAQIEVRGEDEEPPSNVGAAGQSGLIVGDMRVDRNNPRAIWLWAVGDNLRLSADAAADILVGIRDHVQ